MHSQMDTDLLMVCLPNAYSQLTQNCPVKEKLNNLECSIINQVASYR